MSGHRKDAFVRGGHGRHLQNKMSKTTKRKLDRRVDKRRRKEGQTSTFTELYGSPSSPDWTVSMPAPSI